MMSAPPFPAITVGGIPFLTSSLEQACDWILSTATMSRSGVNVRLANAYNVALASRNPDYADLLKRGGVNFPDGTPVVWFMRLNRRKIRVGRVRGPSLFKMTLRKSVDLNVRHFLLGGTPETLSSLEVNVRSAYPGISLVGTYAPPFATIDHSFISKCVESVRSANPDIVWIGLGTPKQDQLGTALAKEIGCMTVNVGAAFDFVGGTRREAPAWIQQSGFEWLYRLLTEPRRLWRRYLFGNLQFMASAVSHLAATRAPEEDE